MHGQRLHVGGFGVDEVIGLNALFDGRDSAHPALQLADYVGQNNVPFELDPRVNQRFQRAEISGVPGFHIRYADAVDKLVVDFPFPRVNGPALGHRISIKVAIKQQAVTAAAHAWQRANRI